MRKTLLIILALMTAIILTGCGGDGDAVVSGDVSQDINISELPVTVASEDVTEVIPSETDAKDETEEPAVTTAPESDETEATTTTASESTTAAATTTASTTTAATTTTKSTTTESTTTGLTVAADAGDDDDEEVEIIWEEGISRDEFEAMFGIDTDADLDTNG